MKFWTFWQKGVNYFWQSVDAILEHVSVAKTNAKVFDAKVLIKRLPSFSVPKITVIRQVKPILKLQ